MNARISLKRTVIFSPVRIVERSLLTHGHHEQVPDEDEYRRQTVRARAAAAVQLQPSNQRTEWYANGKHVEHCRQRGVPESASINLRHTYIIFHMNLKVKNVPISKFTLQ